MSPGTALLVNAVMNNMIQDVPSVFNKYTVETVYEKIVEVCRNDSCGSTDGANVSLLTNKVLNKLFLPSG